MTRPPASASADGGAESGTPASRVRLLLVADDYAMTEAVSRGIDELIAAGRLSATSAMVTTRHWPLHARRVARAKDRAAVGLHFNLTLGQPLTAMPRLAAHARLPQIGALTRAALAGAIDRAEIAAEAKAQIAAFAEHFGALPDFVDGHQHVHALPGIRDGVLAALQEAFDGVVVKPLVRDPADRASRVLARRRAAPKALLLSALAAGFGVRARRAGFPTNVGFAGVSDFAADGAAADFAAVGVAPGERHLVMCHPGYVDAELETLDPLTARRRAELDLLAADANWRDRVVHPERGADGRVDWSRAWAGTSVGTA